MSKVEIAGPAGLLDDVLGFLQEKGVLQIEPESVGPLETEKEKPPVFEDGRLGERLFLEDLRARVDELLACLSPFEKKESTFNPRPIIDTIAEAAKRHAEQCRGLTIKRQEVLARIEELGRYAEFFSSLEPLFSGVKEPSDLDFIAVRLKYPEAVEPLRRILSRLTGGRFEFLADRLSDGTVAGVIAIESRDSGLIRKALGEERMPEIKFDPSFGDLPFPEKLATLRRMASGIEAERDTLTGRIEDLSGRWGPFYLRVRRWAEDRLSVIGATSSAFRTRMCFFIYGWVPTSDVGALREGLEKGFGGRAVVSEEEIREEDLERVPIVLKNPAYFKPFEIFTRVLPLPRYTSYDPTTFVGIFFPIFFGMILGDAGYGVVLASVSFPLALKARSRNIGDAAKIAFVASVYSVIFGLLYGEFFGGLGLRAFGLKPVLVERRTAILPMLFFSLAVGAFHVALGFFLGFVSALRKRAKRQALYKLVSMAMVLCLTVFAASFFGAFPVIYARPVAVAALVLVPVLLIVGGVLAPLEVLKSAGNVISYARIMAIGLASVLLANVADRAGGVSGDVAVGILVAGLLHAMNLLLGVFSPTIHAIRLHYVEFFGKFLEHGGRRFEPLKRGS